MSRVRAFVKVSLSTNTCMYKSFVKYSRRVELFRVLVTGVTITRGVVSSLSCRWSYLPCSDAVIFPVVSAELSSLSRRWSYLPCHFGAVISIVVPVGVISLVVSVKLSPLSIWCSYLPCRPGGVISRSRVPGFGSRSTWIARCLRWPLNHIHMYPYFTLSPIFHGHMSSVTQVPNHLHQQLERFPMGWRTLTLSFGLVFFSCFVLFCK